MNVSNGEDNFEGIETDDVFRSFETETGVGTCDDDCLAGKRVGRDRELDEELTVEKGQACLGTHGVCDVKEKREVLLAKITEV